MEVYSARNKELLRHAGAVAKIAGNASIARAPRLRQASNVPRIVASHCLQTPCDCPKPHEGGLPPTATLPILRPLSADPAARKPLTPLWLSALRLAPRDRGSPELRAESVR